MNKLLISACLLGDPVRYDGKSKAQQHAGLADLLAQDRVIGFCPEVAGGLPIPRPPAEILAADGAAVIAGDARVVTADGGDLTPYFLSGARQALALCQRLRIGVAVLTESSPSCGSGRIYDGSFSRSAIPGSGVTCALLEQNGIRVFSQLQLDDALKYLADLVHG
ncbi:MAG: DUF523 domain-containing protein [Gammaproteobacteria bacterium]|nr:DUF523 domain-containing protein [Gammaproteobacteria bacterium]